MVLSAANGQQYEYPSRLWKLNTSIMMKLVALLRVVVVVKREERRILCARNAEAEAGGHAASSALSRSNTTARSRQYSRSFTRSSASDNRAAEVSQRERVKMLISSLKQESAVR